MILPKSIPLLIGLAVLAASCLNALAQDPVTDVAAPLEVIVQQHIERLSSAQFSERQQAAAELMKLDAAAVPILESAMTVAVGESATRLRQIVTQLRKRLFDDRLETFTTNPSVESAASLPQWDRFAAMAGSDADVLSVFSEILNAERELFATRLFNPPGVSALLEIRSAEFSRLCHGRVNEEFPIASCLALMLLGSEPETRLIRGTSTNISDALDDIRFANLITNGVHAPIVRAVTSEWLNRPGISADRPLLFCISHELAVGRSIAHRIVKSRSRRQDMYYSLLCLARLNNPDDLPLVESLLETPTTLWPPRGRTVQSLLPDRKVESSFSVQTRDVALAVAIHLRGASHADFGIPVQPSDETFFVVYSLGFDNDSVRQQAISKYRSHFGVLELNPAP